MRYDDVKTEATIEEVAAALAWAYRQATGVDVLPGELALLLAHGALETGRWKSMHCWNLGNIKAGEGEDHCYFECDEILTQKAAAEIHMKSKTGLVFIENVRADGMVRVRFLPDHTYARFRAYPSLRMGAVDYLLLLRRRFKSAWEVLRKGDAAAFVDALKVARYFTADVGPYKSAVVSLAKEFIPIVRRLDLEQGEVVGSETEPTPEAYVLGALLDTAKEMVRDDAEEFGRRNEGG